MAHKGRKKKVHPENDHEERHAPDYVDHNKGTVFNYSVMGDTEKSENHASKKRKNT
jgi:hypothetical protein